jgi:hypothetical protein
MTKFCRTMVLIFVFVLSVGVAMSSAFAEKAGCDGGFKKGAKAVGSGVGTVCATAVNYPADLLNDSVNVVGTATKNTADMVVDTGKAVGETVTGDFKKAPQIITAPVKGTANTVGYAAKGTAEAPIKAGRTAGEQNKQRLGRKAK